MGSYVRALIPQVLALAVLRMWLGDDKGFAVAGGIFVVWLVVVLIREARRSVREDRARRELLVRLATDLHAVANRQRDPA